MHPTPWVKDAPKVTMPKPAVETTESACSCPLAVLIEELPVLVEEPLVLTAGVVQLPSSRRKREVPAVAPGSGTAPTWCALPDAPKTGRLEAPIVPWNRP